MLEARSLSRSQKAVIRRQIRAVLGQPTGEVAELCSGIQTKYGVSYECLSLLIPGELPRYVRSSPSTQTLATPDSKPPSERPIPGNLTRRQIASVLAAYRATFQDADRIAAIESFYKKFTALYGLTAEALGELVKLDEQRRPAEYRALRAISNPTGLKTSPKVSDKRRGGNLSPTPTSPLIARAAVKTSMSTSCRRTKRMGDGVEGQENSA